MEEASSPREPAATPFTPDLPEEWHRLGSLTDARPLSSPSELLDALVASSARGLLEEELAREDGDLVRHLRLALEDGRILVATVIRIEGQWLLGLKDTSVLDRLARVIVHRERMAALGTATVTAAHEINNTLTALDSVIPLLEHPSLAPLERAKHMRNLKKEAQRATELVGGLVNLARKWQDEPEALDPTRVVDDVISLKKQLLADARIDVQVDTPTPVPVALTRRADLESALFQLVSNAIEALQAKEEAPRRILVRISGDDNEVFVRVEDNAGGLACSVEDAFARFRSTKPEHAGLGLWVARRDIERNGGRLDIERTDEHGTTVVIALPRVAAALPDVEEEPVETGFDALQAMMGLRVLIVDDEQVLRTGVANSLRLYGPRLIIEAANAAEAMQAIEESDGEFDAVLLDVRLPDGTGPQIYEQIGKLTPELQSRVIFMVGERVEGPILDFLKRTGVPYVSKPFQMQQVIRTVGRVAGRRSTRPSRRQGIAQPRGADS